MANSANALNIKSAGIPVFDGTATFTESTTTQHNVLIGAASNAIANVAPSSTSGVPLISQGASSDPVFGTAVVAGGGTGAVSFTAHGVLLGEGTSAIGVTAVGSTGQVLTGVTGSDPVWASPAASSISITGDSGGALTGAAFTFTGGSTGLTFAGSGSTETLGGTLAIANGGTNATSMATTDGVVYYDGTRLVTTAVGSATQVLTSNGAGNAPTFQAVAASLLPWTDVTGSTVALAVNNGYIMNRSSLITATLPATAAEGSIIALVGKGTGGYTIAQNSGQTIHFGTSNTTTGATGTLSSSAQYDSVELICITANTDFVVRSSIGNLSVV